MTPEYVSQHLLDRGDEAIEPTVSLLRHWFHVLHKAEFGGVLPTPRFEVYEDFDAKEAGWCICDTTYLIRVNAPFNRTRGQMIATLLHEMLHLLQYGLTEDMTHDAWFNDRAAVLSLKYGVDV